MENEVDRADKSKRYLTVKDFMKRYNCGRNTALKHMHRCPGSFNFANKLQVPVEAADKYIQDEVERQRAQAPNVVPRIS